jgi:elongation factor 1-beta
VKCFQAFKTKPDDSFIAKFPNVFRWYKHIATFESDFSSLPGDPSKSYMTYGPEAVEVPVNPAKAPAKAEEEDDDEVDLFGSDDEEEDAEAARIREERLAEYNKKKAAKPKSTVAKSIITLDVKPWDDETVMDELEKNVRAIEKDGLVWGGSKLVPVGYGVKVGIKSACYYVKN